MIKVQHKDVWDNIRDKFLVVGDKDDERYNQEPFCKMLSQYRIAHLGVLSTDHPYELSRVYQNGSCMVVTIEGEGKVLVNGDWVMLPPGQACLLPPFVDNSIKSISGHWKFAWVKYLETEETYPIASSLSPVVDSFDYAPFEHACMGLYNSCLHEENTSLQNLWIELAHKYVRLFAEPKIEDKRLWRLWTQIGKSISRKWSLDEMSQYASLSNEHIRRLCQKQFGRSPKQQLAYIRMRHARILLGSTKLKVETVANRVGYDDVFAFSKAFKRYTGCNPSDMR